MAQNFLIGEGLAFVEGYTQKDTPGVNLGSNQIQRLTTS